MWKFRTLKPIAAKSHAAACFTMHISSISIRGPCARAQVWLAWPKHRKPLSEHRAPQAPSSTRCLGYSVDHDREPEKRTTCARNDRRTLRRRVQSGPHGEAIRQTRHAVRGNADRACPRSAPPPSVRAWRAAFVRRRTSQDRGTCPPSCRRLTRITHKGHDLSGRGLTRISHRGHGLRGSVRPTE